MYAALHEDMLPAVVPFEDDGISSKLSVPSIEAERRPDLSGPNLCVRGLTWLSNYLKADLNNPESTFNQAVTQFMEVAQPREGEDINLVKTRLAELVTQANRLHQLISNFLHLWDTSLPQEQATLQDSSIFYASKFDRPTAELLRQQFTQTVPLEKFIPDHFSYIDQYVSLFVHDLNGSRGLTKVIMGLNPLEMWGVEDIDSRNDAVVIVGPIVSEMKRTLQEYDLEHPLATPVSVTSVIQLCREQVAGSNTIMSSNSSREMVVVPEFPDEVPAGVSETQVMSSVQMLKQILGNSISNAEKAIADSEGTTAVITVAITFGPESMQLAVIDSGNGFPPEFLEDDAVEVGKKKVVTVAGYQIQPAKLRTGQTKWDGQAGTGVGLVTLQQLSREVGNELVAGTLIGTTVDGQINPVEPCGIMLVDFPFMKAKT